jgi:hypothetical protein
MSVKRHTDRRAITDCALRRCGAAGAAEATRQGRDRADENRRQTANGGLSESTGVLRQLWRTLSQTATAWLAHDGSRLAASLSLYSLLSLAPLIVLSIAIASLGFGRSAAQNALVDEVRSMMGEDGARAVQTVIVYGKEPHAGGVASVIGIFTLLVGASSVFGELQSAMNRIWEVESSSGSGVAAFLKARLLSFAASAFCCSSHCCSVLHWPPPAHTSARAYRWRPGCFASVAKDSPSRRSRS